MSNSRIVLQIPALVLVLLGFILLAVALATPAWQVAYARELQQWIQSGLWLSCNTRPSGMYTCTYTFTKDDFDFYTSAELVNMRTPAFYPWQRTLLHIMLVGQTAALFALISFCVSGQESTQKCATIAFNVFTAIATFACIGSIFAFAVFSHMVAYRFYHVSVSGIYEKHHGYSFYIAVVGTIFYVMGLVVSLFYTLRVMRKEDPSGAPINAYKTSLRPRAPEMFPSQTFSSSLSRNGSHYWSEEQFAMRDLPDVPKRKR